MLKRIDEQLQVEGLRTFFVNHGKCDILLEMTLIPHDCPARESAETWFEEGQPCPHGCGWVGAWSSEVEAYRIEKVRQALERWGPFIPLAEAAKRTGIPLSTLAQAAREGRLPALEIFPGRWLVRFEAVKARIGLNPPGERGPRRKKRGEI